MPPSDRSNIRNVFIVLSSNPEKIRGGIYAGPRYTQGDFLTMLSILMKAPRGFIVCPLDSDTHVTMTEDVLAHGIYVMKPGEEGSIVEITDERYYPRNLSLAQSGRDKSFCRARDKMCVISGRPNRMAEYGKWTGYEAARIVPLALEAFFLQDGLSLYITDKKGTETGINSAQNGLLLNSAVHKYFDQYLISVNPFDKYKIYGFDLETVEWEGKTLQQVCRDPEHPHCVRDMLLWWHFKQSVLANMRGAGEPVFEDDFPPGTDKVGEILRGPLPQQRMEFELASRLYGLENQTPRDTERPEKSENNPSASGNALSERSGNVQRRD